MKYACTCINIYVQVYMCAYETREEYSPILIKYSIPSARVHACARECRQPKGIAESGRT